MRVPSSNAPPREFAVTETEVDELSPTEFGLALRTLARLMLRSHQHGDPVANAGAMRPDSRLTLLADASPDHKDDEAA